MSSLRDLEEICACRWPFAVGLLLTIGAVLAVSL